jgi:acyl-CoA reductase-like NAD-dependent aldehyde dehydrogenase
MYRIPILRWGRPYYSLDEVDVLHHRTGEPIARLSQANTGLIGRDLIRLEAEGNPLARLTVNELIGICGRAAKAFMNADLPVGKDSQGPDEFIRCLSASTGMPYSHCARNMEKVGSVLEKMDEILRGLTRGLEPSIIDSGYGLQNDAWMSYFPLCQCLGAVLPNNSPGVHSLWIPAIAMRVPLMMKPGGQEPWTPYRIIQALVASGCPPEAFGYYPAGHEGGTEILRRCGRSMVFGGAATTEPWVGDPRVEIHGPGYSKVILGEDSADRWEEHLDVMTTSILANGGRSCINASAVWTPRHGKAIADALGSRLSKVEAVSAESSEAQLAAFANVRVAETISSTIDQGLNSGGAEDTTARYRGSGRLVHMESCAYLLPTIVWCGSPGHPLANREFLFPYASVVECRQADVLDAIGPTLVVTAITEEREFADTLVQSRNVDRLNLGPIPTGEISWDQPHEGNLFEHLYRRRAFQQRIDSPIHATV